MSIVLANQSSTSLEASINHWGNSGETGFYTVSPSSNESWSRSDSRGFVLVIAGGPQSGTYYVQAGAEVIVRDSSITGATQV